MRKIAIAICVLIAVAIYAVEYSYVVVPKGTNPNDLFSGIGASLSEGDGPAFSAYITNTPTFALNTPTKIPFAVERFDTGSDFNTTSNAFLVPETGYYIFAVSVKYVTATRVLDLMLYVNDVETLTFSGHQTGQADLNGDCATFGPVNLTAGDWVSVYGKSTIVGSQTLKLGSTNNWFAGCKVAFDYTLTQSTTPAVANEFRANKGGNNQAAPSADTWTQVTFSNEVFDTGNNYATTNGAYTVPADGKYQFNAIVGFTFGNAYNDYHLGLYKNDALFLTGGSGYYGGGADGDDNTLTGSWGPLNLSAGDTLKVYVKMGTGSTLQGSITNTWFGGYQLN